MELKRALSLMVLCIMIFSTPVTTWATENNTYTGDDTYYDGESDDADNETKNDDKKETPDKSYTNNGNQYLSWDNDVIVESVNTEILVNIDNSYEVTKTVKVFYNTDDNHQLILSIPLNNMNSESGDVVENATLSSNVESTVFKVESSSKSCDIVITNDVNGHLYADYTIQYTYLSKGDEDSDADFFIQDLAGFKGAPVCSTTFKIVMPYEYTQKDMYFQDIEGQDLLVISKTDFVTITGAYTNTVSDSVTMTLVVEDDYFTKSKNSFSFSFLLGLVNILCIGMICCGFLLAGFSYYQFGKNAKPEIIVNKDIIKDLSPVDMIIALTGGVTNESLLLYILYLANEGYLRIEDTTYKHQKNRNPATGYRLIKLKDYNGTDANIKSIMRILFSDGSIVTPNKLSNKAYKKLDALRLRIQEVGIKDIWEIDEGRRKLCANIGFIIPLLASLLLSLHNLNSGSLVHSFSFLYGPAMAAAIYVVIKRADAYIKKRNVMRGGIADAMTWVYVFIVVFLILILVQTFNAELFVKYNTLMTMGYLSEIILVYCSCSMKKRTEKGTEMCGKIIGFRQYLLESNEIDVKKCVLKDEQYIYKILPYAMALETATEGWYAQMDGCYIDNPKWYSSVSESEFKLVDFMKDWEIISASILEAPAHRKDDDD